MKSNVSRVEALCQRENMFLFDKIAIRIDSIIYFLFYYWNLSNRFVNENFQSFNLALAKALNLKISETLSYQNSVNVAMSHTRKCNSKHKNQTKNVDEDNLQRTVLTIPEVSEEPQEINAVWINVNKCIEITVVWFSLLLAALFILVFLMSSYKIEFVRFNSS